MTTFGDAEVSVNLFLSALLVYVVIGQFSAAYSYVGPGMGIGMLAALWGVIVAVVLAIGGILFWPLRTIIQRWRAAKTKVPPKDT